MAGVAAAATVVVVVPAVLYPLAGLWTLLWLALVAAAAGLLLAGADRPFPPNGSGARTGPGRRFRAHDHRRPDGRLHDAGEHGTGDHTAHSYAGGPSQGTRVGEIALPTAAPDHELHFTAVVHWRWSGHVDLSVRNPVAPAVRDVVARAATKVARTRPRDHARTECDLGAHLAVESAVTGTGIVVWAEHVRLRLTEEDADRLARLSDLRKDLALRAALRAAERAQAPGGAPAASGGVRAPDGTCDPDGTYMPPGSGGTPAPDGAPAPNGGERDHGGAADHHPWTAGVRRPGGGHGWETAAPRAGGPDPDRQQWENRGTGTGAPGAAADRRGAAGPERHPWYGRGTGAEGPDADPGPWGPEHGRDLSHGHGPPPHHRGEDGEEHDYVYLDPVHGMPEEPVFTGPVPGSDVDEYGYESYWWPAESIPDSAEEDVQVAILRGMIDAVPDRTARAEFAERQLRALENAGYTEVARRVREGF